MKLLDVLCSPWAIILDRLQEIAEVYNTHLRGPKIDLSIFKTKGDQGDDQRTYQIENGVAIIEMDGIISKAMSFFSFLFGGVSTRGIEADFKKALNDPEVTSILFAIDSPGGTVDGTQELAELIYKSRGKKPIVAYTDGMMASAAYWIGSAADRIFISGDTTQVGSIGVVAIHQDISKAEEKFGIKTTEIVAGKYKRIASQHAPLTEEGKATIQDIVDHIYSVFVGDVARNRGVSEEEAVGGMGDGRIFLGKKAIAAGLVDGVSTLENLISRFGPKTSRTIRAMVEEKIKKGKEGIKDALSQ